MIVEELHKLQHRHGYLPGDELRSLAERLETPLYRLHEVASYFPHYRLQPPPAADVRVCRDMACYLNGAAGCRRALETLAQEIGGGQVVVGGASCLGQCDRPPAVSINDHVYRGKSVEELSSLVRTAAAGQTLTRQQSDCSTVPWQIDPYQGQPRYEQVRKFIDAWRADPDTDRDRKRIRLGDPILKVIETSGLRGMGGAAFPTHRKWATVRGAPGTVKYAVCNADESEPGTFKDRELLRRAPHLVVEGLIIDALVTGAERGWIFIRHEYEEEIAAVCRAVAEAKRMGFCGERIMGSDLSFPLEVFVSPGGYICGEETALLEVLEDRRAEPRNKPPLMSLEGLFGKPTSMNNVETFSWVPAILAHGGPWYRDQGVNGSTGLRLVSVSGDVIRPGVYEVPFGLTVRELVFDVAGGIRGGQRLKAIASSGPSGGFLPMQLAVNGLPHHFVEGLAKRQLLAQDATSVDTLALPLDPDIFKPFPDFMLGAAFVVYGDRANMLEASLNCVEFYRNESCGKCVPCRIGSEKLAEMLRRLVETGHAPDWILVQELSDAMLLTSICGLGQVVPNSIKTVLKYFREDVDVYLRSP